MRRRHLILLGAACLGVVACSTDESPPSDSPALGGTVGTPPIDDANVPAPPPRTPGEDDTVLDTLPLTPDTLGTCDVVVTGDHPAAWRTVATIDSITYGPWLSDAAVEAAAVDSVVIDASYLQLSCRGTGTQSVSIVASAAVPQRAATYELTYDIDGTVPSDRNRFVVGVELDEAGLCRLAGDGVVDITSFDDDGIVGTFDFPALCPSGAELRATGRFDYRNPEPLLTPPPDTTPDPGDDSALEGCAVQVSGDVIAEFESGEGRSDVTYGPWDSATEGTSNDGLDPRFFLLTCEGTAGELITVSTAFTTGTLLGLQPVPANYSVAATDGSIPGALEATVFFPGNFSWGVTSGTVTINEFDDTHVAGRYTLNVIELKPSGAGGSPPRTAIITADFDLPRPG